ncbi:hypothetical protein ACJJTC_003873 [Scirpophaga incertulas]
MVNVRGALIIIEGLDRTGKSTQCKKLVENLNKKLIKAINTNFPNRNTDIGNVIDKYLKSQNNLSDETIHLLFSANRWELAKDIIKTLEQGTSIIVDRYCYSGAAFSAAKGLDLEWCKSADVGLPKPDKVFFLTMPMDVIENREGYGMERYENYNFQKKVSDIYHQLMDTTWEVVDANRSIKVIEQELLEKSLNVINNVDSIAIGKVWM